MMRTLWQNEDVDLIVWCLKNTTTTPGIKKAIAKDDVIFFFCIYVL